MKKKIFLIISSVMLIVCVILAFSFTYLNSYYHTNDEEAISFIEEENIEQLKLDNDYIVYKPKDGDCKKAIIFYPGGKVEYTAYGPLLADIANKGVMTILVKMPFNLAVFNSDAADGLTDKYKDIETWYIGGHSLGGAMASKYAYSNITKFKGLILLGAYSTYDLSTSSLEVMTIYGSNDKVMKKSNYDKAISNYPSTFKQYVIDGGNHAYFGMYGKQDGDGEASITNEEQIIKTSNLIGDFICGK